MLQIKWNFLHITSQSSQTPNIINPTITFGPKVHEFVLGNKCIIFLWFRHLKTTPPSQHNTYQKFFVGAFLSAQHPQEKLQSMRIIELEREYYNDSNFWLRTFYIFCLTLFKTLKNIVKYSLHSDTYITPNSMMIY